MKYVGSKNRETSTYTVKWQRQSDKKWLPVLWYSFFIMAAPYVVWRTMVTNWASGFGVFVFVAELYGVLTTGLFLFVAKEVFTPLHHMSKQKRTVDVLIPTYSEPLTILEPVVIGATKIRGVRDVLVLDDGNRPFIRQMAERLGVRYYARTTNEDAKAGNLNMGLTHTDAELLITLDADHIPLPNFIEEAAGYFDDPLLAFVQSPQSFYNTHAFLFRKRRAKEDWSEQIMFYNCLQPAKNNWNAAFFVGTSALLRRSALDDVGGFATGTATEDIHTSLRLHAKGWRSIFLPKPLAYGLESENFKEFYKQRRRWAAGSLGLLFRSPDSPLRAKGLTLAQRLNYLSACLAHLQGVQKLCFLLTPVLVIFTNVPPITGRMNLYVVFFAVYFCVALTATWAYSRGTYHLIYTEMFGLASILAHVGGLKGILKVQKKFSVSTKTTVRQDGAYLKAIMWAISLIAVVAIIRASTFYLIDHRHTALVVSSLVLLSSNTLLLVSFLLNLRSYEQGDEYVSYKALPPTAKYNYIALD